MSNSNKIKQQITLKNRRKLSFAEFGDLEGKPIFHFHGGGGSRLGGKLYAKNAFQQNIRFITIDRPGIGNSDFKKDRKLLDWPNDVIELANFLKIEKFAVNGYSAGGPYALACAYKILDRLTACSVICGSGPLNINRKFLPKERRRFNFIIRKFPSLYKKRFKTYINLFRSPEQFQKLVDKENSSELDPDSKLYFDPKFHPTLLEDLEESILQGLDGQAQDLKIVYSKWGFKLKDISPKIKVFMWSGEFDPFHDVNLSMSKVIPNCEVKIYPAEGHLSIIINKNDEILATLSSL
jgi:pimeloyl-ACP methyl ester carboxylesterase